MPKISVIVPVYNAEKYIERCIESILNQTFQDIELILVDDGSTDESGKTCDDYLLNDNRVKVIHQKNAGVSAARQAGLDSANSEYVIFVDSDDWVDCEMYADLVVKAETTESDVVICDYYVCSDKDTYSFKSQKPTSLCGSDVLRDLLNGKLHGSTCNKLYRLSKLKNEQISFPKNIGFCEDLWFNCELFMCSNLIVSYKNKAYYYYDFYSNPSGLSRKFNTKSVEDYKRFTNFIFESLDEGLFQEEFKRLRFNLVKLAFRSNCSTKLFYSLFPDRMNEFKDRLSKIDDIHFIMKSGLRLAFNGQLLFGRYLVMAYVKLYLPIARLKIKCNR